MPGYVYLLHFDSYLHHAQHYLGSTPNPQRRLAAHARGRGSRLCKALREEGISWRLGALGTTSLKNMRKLERLAKNWKSASKFCEHCTELPLPLPGTMPYSVAALPYATDSKSLDVGTRLPETITVCLSEAIDIDWLLPQFLVLMQQNREELGFIPAGGSLSMRSEIAKGQFVYARSGESLLGYAYFTIDRKEERVKIQQLCVREEDRGSGIGRAIVDGIRKAHPEKMLGCCVRDDLPANEFWQHIGFVHVLQLPHHTSGKPINHYVYYTTKGV